jgi:signal transduction histidine kinase
VEIRTEPGPGHITLVVQDRGIGIPENLQKRVFGMFEQVHDGNYEGTGVGLAIVKRAAERMNGHVRFAPTPGGGSTFYVELPVQETADQPTGSDR